MQLIIDFLLFPFYVVLVLMFMVLVVLALPVNIPFLKRYFEFSNQEQSKQNDK